MRLRVALAAAVVTLTACGGAHDAASLVTIDTLPGGIIRTMSRAPTDSGHWRLELERTVQPAEGAPGELNAPGDLALADDGTLYVMDEKPSVIKRFDPQGALVRTIGREGDGPGEFRSGMIALHGDTLVLQDPRATRATMFNSNDGSLLTTRPSVCCYWAPIGIMADGRAAARIMGQSDSLHPAQLYFRWSLDGQHADTARVTERPTSANKRWLVRDETGRMIMSTSVLLSPNNVHAIDPTGGFISGWGAEYLLRTSRNGTDTVALFGRTGEPPLVSSSEKASLIDHLIKDRFGQSGVPEANLRASFKVSDIPDHRPAFENVHIDGSGRRWVRLATADTVAAHFDLFDKDGRWLDQVMVVNSEWAQRTFQSTAWSKDHVAIGGEGVDGRPLIRVYHIVRKESR